MQQEEPVLTVLLIEPCDAVESRGEKRFIAGRLLGRGIGPVGEQREVQLAGTIGEVMNLEPFDQFRNVVVGGEKRGHRHECAQVSGNAVAESQARQDNGPQQLRQRVIDHGHANLEGGSQRQQDQEAEERDRYTGLGERPKPDPHDQPGDQRNGSEIAGQARGPHGIGNPPPQRRTVTDRSLKTGAARAHDVIAWMCRGFAVLVVHGGGPRQCQARDFEFTVVRVL